MPEETTTQTTTTQPHPQNETFSKEYVAELNKENGKWRIKSTEQETRAQEAENAAKKAAEEADAKVAAASKAADARVILAEMKAVAIKAGMVDVDGLKLADLSNLKLSESGEVEGAEALIEALKKSKPYLFGAVGSTSSTQAAPKPGETKPKKVSEMTPAERKAEAKRLGFSNV